MTNTLKTRLKCCAQEMLIGSLVSVPSPEVAEIMARVGFDYLWIDVEHGPADFVAAQHMIQATGDRCASLIRVPDKDEVWLKKALDTGCDGVIVPQIQSAEEAKAVVDACLYPPEGRRSVGITRAHAYGMAFQDYVETANKHLLIVLQVEHVAGVRHIEAIVQVPGIDVILVGPYDLSGSLNLLGQVDHPTVQEHIAVVRQACAEAGVTTGIFVADVPAAKRAIDQGFQLIALGMDAAFLWQGAGEALKEVRKNLRSQKA